MKKIFSLLTVFILGLNLSSKACSPLVIPTLTSFNMIGSNLNLFWTSNTTYACTYSIQVEFACLGNSFTGTGSPPFYISPSVTKPNTLPFAYPVQVINTSTLCPGTVYQFRAREQYGAFTFSGWTSTFTFTTPGVFVAPTLTLTASPVTVCPPQTSQLTASVINGCGTALPYSYTWSPAAGLSCINCANPVASPVVATNYTCTVKGGPLGCWTISKSISVGLGTPPSITLTGSITVGFNATPSQGFSPLNVSFNNTTQLGATITGTVSTWWGYGNGSIGTFTNVSSFGSPNGQATYAGAGTYTVVLVVTQSVNVAGHTTFCTGTATNLVVVDLPSQLDIPNVFTPSKNV